MTIKYCDTCKELGQTRVLNDFKKGYWRGIPVKVRKVIHLYEDGGCGRTWHTIEMPIDMLDDFEFCEQ